MSEKIYTTEYRELVKRLVVQFYAGAYAENERRNDIIVMRYAIEDAHCLAKMVLESLNTKEESYDQR